MVRSLVRRYCLLNVLFGLAQSIPAVTYAIFLQSHGLDHFQTGMVNFFFWTTMAIAEVPTGTFADVFGRKKSFIIACLIEGFGVCVYSQATSFWGFVVAEVIGGIGITFYSGAFDAWITDELGYHGVIDEDARRKVYGKGDIARYASMILAGIIVANLAKISLVWPWLAGGAVAIITAITATLIMPEHSHQPKPRGSRQTMITKAKTSFNFCRQKPLMWQTIASGVLLSFVVQGPNMQWSPFFENLTGKISSIGLINMGMAASLAIGALLIVRSDQKASLSNLYTCLFLTGLGLIGTMASTNIWWIMSPFLIHEVARGSYGSLRKSLLNELIDRPDQRATILSFDAFCLRCAGIVGLPLFGWLADHHSIRTTWFIVGVLLIFVGWPLHRKRK